MNRVEGPHTNIRALGNCDERRLLADRIRHRKDATYELAKRFNDVSVCVCAIAALLRSLQAAQRVPNPGARATATSFVASEIWTEPTADPDEHQCGARSSLLRYTARGRC